MNIYQAIINRRSIRKFKEDNISDSIILKLLEAARWAPSGGNIQPWFFYVVKDHNKREQLAAAALGQKFIAEAPLCIVVCAEPEMSAIRYQQRGAQLYCLQDTAAAVQNIMLAALEEGLASCWVGAFQEDKVQQVLGIPRNRRPVALIPLGYLAREPGKAPVRKEIAEISQWV